MKVACIYFPIKSVGGIATVAANLKRAALEAGDTFDVLRCSNASRIEPGLFESPKRINGGDTHILIDGEAPHGDCFLATKWFLETNYDALFFVHPCCHHNSDYGDDPRWFEMYTSVNLPKAMHVADGYAETYPMVKDAIGYCEGPIWVNQAAYAIPLKALGIASQVLPHPFASFRATEKRSKVRLTLFPNQWKNIKCPIEFLKAMPKMKGPVELFSNGIVYYQVRLTQLWRDVIGEDLFVQIPYEGLDALRGPKNRRFHGNIPLPEIAKWYQKGWSIVDLMGQRAKFGAYREGSFNYTALEALWYGARPILHEQARKAVLPQDLITTIDLGPKHSEVGRIADAVNAAEPLSTREQKRAQEWIFERHDARKMWVEVKKPLAWATRRRK